MVEQAIACPFPPCQARVGLAHCRSLNLGTPAVDLIREHRTTPGEWFGTCPASLMAYPLAPHEQNLLGEQAGAYEAMAVSRPARNPEPDGPRAPGRQEERRQRRPRPDQDPYWFQPSGESSESDDGSRPRRTGPTARPILTLIQPDDTRGSAPMASVADTRALIASCNQAIAEAQDTAQAAVQRFTDAAAQLAVLRGSSGQELGAAQVRDAIESCETAVSLASQAIEINAVYGAHL